MIPDLGKYATEVLLAYGVSITLLIVVVGLSLRRSRRLAAQLKAVEARQEAGR